MDKLLYGAAYYDEYMPVERLDEDIRMMKKAGMNVVRIGESTWSTFEVQDGEFDFSHLDKVMDAMDKAGISVILGTPTYAVPTWLVKSYPEVLATTVNGRGIYGARQIMDITNPTYLFYAERAIRRMMEHCASHTSVIGVQLDNETKAYGTAGPNVQERFVKYIRNKFGKMLMDEPELYNGMPEGYKGVSQDDILDYVNYEFGFDYWSNRINTWEDFPDVRGTINGSFKGEFKRFQRLLVTEFLLWQSGIVRGYLRDDQFITHNTDFSWKGYSYGINGETDVCDNAQALDIAGTDIYHITQDKLTGMTIAFGGDVTRSLKRDNYLVLETEAQGFPGWLPYDGQLRLQAYSHLASGADMVEYWHWHSLHNAIETYWKGVLSQDFKENDTYRAACVTGNEWKRIGEHLVHLKKDNRVAILLSQESLTALDCFPIDEESKMGYNDVLMEVYDCLYKMNVECDFIWPQQKERLKDYELIVIPALYSASQELIDALDHYIKEGGHAFMTFKSAFTDEHIKVWHDEAPHGLAKAFGISYSHFTWPHGVGLRFEGPDITGDNKEVRDFMELLEPDGAKVLISYDHKSFCRYAALTRNSYGKGSATYLGCNVSEDILRQILSDTVKEAGIELNEDSVFPLIHRKGRNNIGKTIHYFMNYSGEELRFTPGMSGVELISGEDTDDKTKLTLAAWDLAIIEEG
ncbi:MAG: beta-galactosidase [Lachnospiraceae bacterium]|nr:beta-galactosidase [Lachnospiraceae bacterium]